MPEIHKLPEGWKLTKISEVCEINPRIPKEFQRLPEALTTFVPMAAVDEKTGSILNAKTVPYHKVAKGYTYFEENDVLFAKITPCMQNGKHAIARDLIDGIGFGSTEFHVLRPKRDKVIPEWIWYFIRQPCFLREAAAYFTGAVGQQRVPEYFLSQYVIPLPPLSVQQRIVAKVKELMDDVEKARTACERQLEAVKALPAAYLRQVFESEEAKKWERKRLGEVCEVTMGQSPPGHTYSDTPIGLPFFQGKADFGGYFPTVRVWCSHPIKIAEEGDVLISVRAPVGPVNMSNLKCCIGRGLAAIRCRNNPLNWYVFWYLRFLEPQMSLVGSGSTFNAVTYEELYEISIPLPPLSVQQRIVAELREKMAEVEKLRQTIEKQLETINALPQAILRKAFRGEL
ncbi:MAG: restriction endonuclease subunit S [candidate division WOR-3 bacterium]|uniref:Restriction endonuclease subunit S n=1 Tax=candidate division WOR-3 bacterium TaxID=2052148 RepID=A0A7C1N9L2_UNCW3|nr:restriction endonuclease subunit S [candidate division WOR-3 bacterium]